MGRHSKGPTHDPYYPPQAILHDEPCHACGKTSFASRHAAQTQIKRLDRDNKRRGRRDTLMHAYECPHGNGWHLAHTHSQGQRTRASNTPRGRVRRFVEWEELEAMAQRMREADGVCAG